MPQKIAQRIIVFMRNRPAYSMMLSFRAKPAQKIDLAGLDTRNNNPRELRQDPRGLVRFSTMGFAVPGYGELEMTSHKLERLPL